MPPPQPSLPASAGAALRRRPLPALVVLAAVLLLAGGALVWPDADTDAASGAPPKGPGTAAAPGTGEASPSAPAGPGQEEARAPRFDATTCWEGLEGFDAGLTLEGFRAWAAPLLAGKDGLVRDYLVERLAELIGADAGRALVVLGWAKEAEGREFRVLLEGLRTAEAVHAPQVAARLLEAGLDPALSAERRAGLLSALDTQKRLGPAALARLTDFARDPASGEAGWAATRTLGRVMKRDAQAGGAVAPYLEGLLSVGSASPDEQVRYLAQMMPMHTAPLLDGASTERYAAILRGEGNEDGRDAAAHNLSLSQEKAQVLALFARTFETEASVCVRWALFRFASRVSGAKALPVMEAMARQDPRFLPHYATFAQLYAGGTRDWVRLWNALPDQDPFGCLDRHG
jgi:hypothetical protein